MTPEPGNTMRQAGLVSIAAAACCVLSLAGSPRAQQDNLLILIADDLGVDNVGCYGEGVNPPPTPNIDGLAARGVMFRNAWSNPVCSATRACLMTGRYATRTGVGWAVSWGRSELPDRKNALPLSETTLPELLDARQSGYAHGAFGKWHLSNKTNGGKLGPNLAGWSHFAGLIEGAATYYWWPRTVNGVTRNSGTYTTTQIVDDALAWIQSAPEPWVAYVAFTAPHAPFHSPPGRLHTRPLPGRPKVNPIPYYKAMVESMDTEIGPADELARALGGPHQRDLHGRQRDAVRRVRSTVPADPRQVDGVRGRDQRAADRGRSRSPVSAPK